MNTNEMLGTETILIKEEFKNNDTIDLGDYLPQSPLHSLQTTGTEVTPPSVGQIKCGEIFIINEKLKYVCYYCGYIDEDSDNFENHIFMEHYILNKNEEENDNKNRTILDLTNNYNEYNKQKYEDSEEENDNKDSIIKPSTCLVLTYNQIECKKPQYRYDEEENYNKDPLTSEYLSNLDFPTDFNPNKNDDTNNELLDPTNKMSCEFCERTFDSHTQIKNHFKHFRKQQNICTICDKKTCGMKYFKLHMKLSHDLIDVEPTNKKSFSTPKPPFDKNQIICNYCDKDLITNHQLRRHLSGFRNHRNICTICQQQTCGVKQFMEHMSSVHEIDNITPPSLIEHPLRKRKRKETPEIILSNALDNKKPKAKPLSKPNPPYNKNKTICNYCDRDLITNQQYRRHLTEFRYHRNICTICEKQTCGYKQFMEHMSFVHNIENVTPPSVLQQPLRKKIRKGSSQIELSHDLHNEEPKDKSSSQPQLPSLPYNKIQTICNYCDKDLITNLQYRRHLTRFRNHRNSCTICQKQTCGAKQFMEHMSSVHDIENIKPPSILKQPLKKRIKSNTQKKEYFCDLCKFVCRDLSNFIVHKRTHTGERPYVCKFCNKSFIQNSEKKLHERRFHTGEKPFQCSECGKCFPFLRILNTHIRTVHLKHERISAKCTICSKVLVSEAYLEKHINDVHRDDRPFVCDICQKAFKTRKILYEHKKIHSDKKTYECNYCGLKFFQSAGRRGHIRRVHEDKEIS